MVLKKDVNDRPPFPPNAGAASTPPTRPDESGPMRPRMNTPALPIAPVSQPSLPLENTQAIPTPAVPITAAPTQSSQFPAVSATGQVLVPAAAAVAAAATAPRPAGKRITVQYPQVGSRLTAGKGEYEVLRVLGSGEFGAVYECLGPFDQVYAVKVIRPANRPYAEVYGEWARETQRLTSLRHPNIVYIYDAFELSHLFYMALEKCDHALKDMLGAPMQEGLVLELGRQLLAAVQFLHDNDIVHDDLHPGNVLISHSVDRPIVKISDFGISHELRGMSAIRPNVVHHLIMAPEVVASGYTSKQSDIYQCGLLLYWMLTGAPAIPAGVPYDDIVRIVADGHPRKLADSIGTPLGELISKMLRRRDAYRYTSAREVWADMRKLPSWQNRQLFPVK